MTDITTFACRKCKLELPLSSFHKHTSMPHGISQRCKACVKIYTDKNRDKIRTRFRAWILANKDKVNKARQLKRTGKIKSPEQIAFDRQMNVALRRIYKNLDIVTSNRNFGDDATPVEVALNTFDALQKALQEEKALRESNE